MNLCLKTNPVYFGISLVLNMNFVHTGCKWNTFSHTDPSLRSKRFHGVSAQIKAKSKKRKRGFFWSHLNFSVAKTLKSAQKPYRNACYAGYTDPVLENHGQLISWESTYLCFVNITSCPAVAFQNRWMI